MRAQWRLMLVDATGGEDGAVIRMKARRTYGYRTFHALSVVLLAACQSANKQPAAPHASDTLPSFEAGSSDAGAEAHDTARAQVMLQPTVAAEGGADAGVALGGRVDLWEHGQAVTLKLDIRGCTPGSIYQARVSAGSDCSATETWSAGAGIDMFGCTTRGAIIAYYARHADNDKPWSIGGAADTDVVGHALMLSEVATGQTVTCGVVERAPDAPLSETTDTEGPTVQIRGAVAGVCVFDRQVPKQKPNCPDYAAATACASTYCELNRCIDSCATYVQCLAEAHGEDICKLAYTCEPSADCSSCQSDVVRCEVDVCIDKLSCAEPLQADGPCSKLKRCCAMTDTDPATCLDFTRDLARFGDADCQRVIDYWGSRGMPCTID